MEKSQVPARTADLKNGSSENSLLLISNGNYKKIISIAKQIKINIWFQITKFLFYGHVKRPMKIENVRWVNLFVSKAMWDRISGGM